MVTPIAVYTGIQAVLAMFNGLPDLLIAITSGDCSDDLPKVGVLASLDLVRLLEEMGRGTLNRPRVVITGVGVLGRH
jgi:hypothetical protein